MTTTVPNYTFTGRLSFPKWTAQEDWEKASPKYKKKTASEHSPSLELLLNQGQFDRYVAWLTTEFLPYTAKQYALDKSGKNALSPEKIKKIEAYLADIDSVTPPFPLALKPVQDASKTLAPDVVARVVIKGPLGGKIAQAALIRDPKQLLVDDGSHKPPLRMIVPIEDSIHELYPGCVAKVTAEPFVYGDADGIRLTTGSCQFARDDTRFGGGPVVDTDAMFADDDE